MRANLGEIVPISTVDWHGRSSCTIFLNGCDLRCPYCQNYKLLNKVNMVDIEKIERDILDTKRFISTVVFSGGEPTMQPGALFSIAKFVKRQGLLVGIQTNGCYPEILKKLANEKLVDKIFLDVKADLLNPERYGQITGNINAHHRVIQSLHIPNVAIEARTTIFRSLNDTLEIATYLLEHNYNNIYIIQQGVPWNAPDDKIKKEDILTRKEIISIAKNVKFLQGVKIRTREKGEEYIWRYDAW